MSLKCIVNTYDDKPISDMHITITLIENPNLVFDGYTDSEGIVTRWRSPEDDYTMILGPGWVLSDMETRWRITYETNHHLHRDHPFSTISMDLLVSSYCNHEVALVLASTSYGVFESRTAIHGLFVPEGALNHSPALNQSPALSPAPGPVLNPALKQSPALSPAPGPVLNHSPTRASSPTLGHTQSPPGSISPLMFCISDVPVAGGSQIPEAAALAAQATPAVTKGKRKNKGEHQCPGEKGSKKSRRSVKNCR